MFNLCCHQIHGSDYIQSLNTNVTQLEQRMRALTLSYGSELIGMQRDWNEELQSCWEFPHTTAQERILRDRALYKVTSDFVDSALSGAAGVMNRYILPINPTGPDNN